MSSATNVQAQDSEESLRFPIGRFQWTGSLTSAERSRCIEQLASCPSRLREAVENLNKPQLDTPYRPGGWTVRQVVHHVPDSHINAYVRLKLALTEENPLIKPYDEAAWATLPDNHSAPIEVSLTLLENLHYRWVVLLRSMTEQQWSRTFRHPDLGEMSLEKQVALYAWHGRHHVAHIVRLREREGW